MEKFLLDRKPGSIGLDVGCGNGKYFGVNKGVYLLGSDRSSELVRIAFENKQGKFADTAVSDGLSLPYRPNYFDFAISIAVIHHFSTRQRRIQAIEHILSKLRENGEALIFVWALEQKKSRRGWDEGMDQDVMVPWVLQQRRSKQNEQKPDQSNVVKNRYYHLYRKGELEEDVQSVNGIIVDSGYERDNWWAIIRKS